MCSTVSTIGLPSTGWALTYCSEPSEGPPSWSESWGHVVYVEKLRDVQSFSFKKRVWGDIPVYIQGRYREDETRLFSEVPSNKTRGSRCKFETRNFS